MRERTFYRGIGMLVGVGVPVGWVTILVLVITAVALFATLWKKFFRFLCRLG